MDENIGKNISKSLSGKIARNFFIMLDNPQKMRLKLLQNDQF